VLSEFDSLALLGSAGIPVVQTHRAADPEGALVAASEVGYPVAVKLDADGLAHKTEAGAVALGLADGSAVEAAADRLLAAGRDAGLAVRGVLVQPMAPSGVELIVGARRDALFGPVVMVGLGGVLAEVLDDVAIGLAPISEERAATLLASLRASRLLNGPRGGVPVDRAAVARLIVALGRAIDARPDLLEVDLNPVIASAAGAVPVDALIVVEDVPGR
jgi:succinyl-CoA synthetase beta subunit